MITPREAIAQMVAADGDPKLAAARAHVTEAELLTAIAGDPTAINELAQQMRVKASLATMSAFRIVHARMIETLPNLSAKDTSLLYTRLLENIADFSVDVPPAPTDPTKALLGALPAEVADHVEHILRASAARISEPEGPLDNDDEATPATNPSRALHLLTNGATP